MERIVVVVVVVLFIVKNAESQSTGRTGIIAIYEYLYSMIALAIGIGRDVEVIEICSRGTPHPAGL
jgi:hypothetical protein